MNNMSHMGLRHVWRGTMTKISKSTTFMNWKILLGKKKKKRAWKKTEKKRGKY